MIRNFRKECKVVYGSVEQLEILAYYAKMYYWILKTPKKIEPGFCIKFDVKSWYDPKAGKRRSQKYFCYVPARHLPDRRELDTDEVYKDLIYEWIKSPYKR